MLLISIKNWASWLLSFLFPDRNRIKLQHSSIRIIKQIGEGGFSFVYLVKAIDNDPERSGYASQEYYALKKIKIQVEEQELAFERELEYYQKFKSHPNLIPLLDFGLIQTGQLKEGYFLFYFYQNGTVQDLIKRLEQKNTYLDFDQLMYLFHGICQGLLVFHSQNPPLAFRDLKPANILIDYKENPVLMDFGSVAPARHFIQSRKEALALQDICSETCTAPFRAPELFEIYSQAVLDERTDIWSLGCTLFSMAYRQFPFDGTATSAVSGQIPFPSVPDLTFPNLLNDLIRDMLQVDLSKRPFLPEIIERVKPYISS